MRNHQATVLSSGRSADIAYLLCAPKIVVFDLARDKVEHTNFGVMEDIKNGRIFSPKYESSVKIFASPHVIVFANEPCPAGKFSVDRIESIYLQQPIPIQVPDPITTASTSNGSFAFNFNF